jgi:AraC-like DNA-binding protein
MFQQVINPTGLLKQFIDYYYVLETNNLVDFVPKQRVYPYGYVILVFHYGQPSIFQKRNEAQTIEPRTVICGQQTSFYDLSLAGKTGMIMVVFRPYGAGMFFKMPMNIIANRNITLEHLVKQEAFELEDKILNAGTIQERIMLIENFLIDKLAQCDQNGKQIISVFDKINYCKGLISVKQLAEASFLSVKQFERKFSGLVGLMPKQFLRIVRFQNTLQMRNHKRFEDYTALAYQCGYYDQSHLINEFKLITGSAPKEFFEDSKE